MEDDEIPTNQYGNVEVIRGDTSQVPKGAVWIDERMAFKVGCGGFSCKLFLIRSFTRLFVYFLLLPLQAATTLGFPCKHAVIGFEKKGGARVTVPMMQGCICKVEHEQAVRDAAICLQEAREERGEEGVTCLLILHPPIISLYFTLAQPIFSFFPTIS